MMGITDRHFQTLMRLMTRHTTLYTPMIAAAALVHGCPRAYQGPLPAVAARQPLILQLGGSDPDLMAQAARQAVRAGLTAIDINAGCPSAKVQKGQFGVCLMRTPARVAACIRAMRQACPHLSITVKTRIGIDHQEDEAFLLSFVDAVTQAGASALTLHARKAWLTGLNPKQNRTAPPLRPERAVALKKHRPTLPVVLNGGITDLAQAHTWLQKLDGVMIGRAAVRNPWMLTRADRDLYQDPAPLPTRRGVVGAYLDYAQGELHRHGGSLPRMNSLIQPLCHLLHGCVGARAWRQLLADVRSPDALTARRKDLIDLAAQADQAPTLTSQAA